MLHELSRYDYGALQAELLTQLAEEDVVKQMANKTRAAKRNKKKAKLPALPSARSADAAPPATEYGMSPAGDADTFPVAGSGAAEQCGEDVKSEQPDLAALSLSEHLSRKASPPQAPSEQWEVQPRGWRAAGRKAAPELAPRSPMVLEVRKADLRRPSTVVPAAAERPHRQPEAETWVSFASPTPLQSRAGPQFTGRWAAVVAGVPLPATPAPRPLPPPCPPEERLPASVEHTLLPAPPLPYATLHAAPRGGVSQVPHPFAAWQTAAAEPAADVSRASSYSLWGGGMSDLSRASLPLSSSRDSLSAYSDAASLYGSPPVPGSQQLGAGLSAVHGSSCQAAKQLAVSPLFTGKASSGIWSAFSLGPAASPFGGAFKVGPAPACCDPTPTMAPQ